MPRPLILQTLVVLLLASGFFPAGRALAGTPVEGGVTRIAFDAQVLADLGITAQLGPGPAVVLPGGTLEVRGDHGDFEGFSGGSLAHDNGLALHLPAGPIELPMLRFAATADPLTLELRDESGVAWLRLRSPHAHIATPLLELRNADLAMTEALATALGRPALAGAYLGRVEADWQLGPSGPGAAPAGSECEPDFELPLDVELTDLRTVTQKAREPGGRVVVSALAELSNVGEGAIEWNQSIAPDSPVGPHPYLALSFYRLVGDVLEQVGRADVKHAFFATNTGCPCAGGSALLPGCSDVYGVNTNIDRHHLAPREEVSAFTGDWERVGSHFDGGEPLDFRNHSDEDHDDFEHRLLVMEAELGTPGARFFFEGWYVVGGDVDLLNGVGRLEVAPSFAGSTWAFPAVSPMTTGSILDELVDPLAPAPGQASALVDTGVGRVQLALRTQDLGGGLYRYEYALMNFDFDAQIGAFEVPRTPGVAFSNAVHRDGDEDASNDWTLEPKPGAVRFVAPPGGALDWGELASFGFDATAAPVAAHAELGGVEPSGPAATTVPTLAPLATPVPTFPFSGSGSIAGPWLMAGLALLAGVLLARHLRARASGPGRPGSR